jgi:hypothetical protein
MVAGMSKLPVYSAFITEFLRETQLPRISAQEPTPNLELIQRVAAAKDHEIAAGDGVPASAHVVCSFLRRADWIRRTELCRRYPPAMERISMGWFTGSMTISIMRGTGFAVPECYFRRPRCIAALQPVARRSQVIPPGIRLW